jgi:hypothetical protein
MNINFTLIIQACNFIIAYLILRFLFFKPAYHAIEEERSYHQTLSDRIETGQAMLNHLNLEKQQEWQTYQQDFSRSTPNTSQPDLYIYKGITPEIFPTPIDENQRQQLELDMVQTILKKVGS